MNELEQMKQIWQEQGMGEDSTKQVSLAATRLPSALEKKLRLFDQENGYGSFLFGAIAMMFFAATYTLIAFKKAQPIGLIASLGFLGASVTLFRYYQKSKILAKPQPEESFYEYVKGKYQQLVLFHQLKVLRIVFGFLVAIGLTLINWPSIPHLQGKELAAVIAFLVFGLFIGAVLIWWYQTQHPYRTDELQRELKSLLDQFEEEDSNQLEVK
ncbi:MAG: hypothetical protein NWR72_12495 [Bacteroidia bacterium]|nr:hypothetical protein [Bacteroidia bacterium]